METRSLGFILQPKMLEVNPVSLPFFFFVERDERFNMILSPEPTKILPEKKSFLSPVLSSIG